ncbi:hypothetical protein Sjap_004391 [Stephania japonica]|uniref:Uncharacterized protein n=1 Tax=Stephania japonica TaxID=461633 RepID=A0AAP0PGZ5_9MAGN
MCAKSEVKKKKKKKKVDFSKVSFWSSFENVFKGGVLARSLAGFDSGDLTRRIAGILGLSRDEPHVANDEDDEIVVVDHENDHHGHQEQPRQGQRGELEELRRSSRKGFSVKAPVAVDRGPVLTPSLLGDGGVQGLRWYAQRLKIDEDGDVADEFFDEVLPDISSLSSNTDNHQRPPRKLKVKCSTQPAIVRKQMVAVDGRIHHGVEYQGRLQWV